jgi:DNA-binding GntR family transcriptional regulator
LAPRGTYRRIADELRRLIAGGKLPAGAMLPSELSLAQQHSVSRGTARSALTVLVDEGLVEVVPGQGRRVVGDAVDRLPQTEWGRVAAALRDRLAAGDFPPGTAMPSEAALVAEFGVSRNTVRRAYRYLADTGLVVVRHGAGAFVAPR